VSCWLNMADRSRLYSEKAYVLSRSFVKTALEKPPTGLEKEIRWLYLTKQRLDRVISHATPLIQKAEATAKTGIAEESEEAAWNADAVGSLTTGAALTIKRTIASLTRIRDSSRS
jgi:ubiquitin-conjugating enzyme E2 O